MKSMMKKMWPIAAASLVAITGMAQAADDSADMRSSDAKRQEKQVPVGYNLSAKYAKEGYGPYVSGDFLWWKACQEDLQYTACVNNGFSLCGENEILDSFKADVREPDFKWDPGFRIGIGYAFPRDGWDLAFQWTRFYTEARDKCCAFPCDVVSSTVANGPAALAAGVQANTTQFSNSACCATNPCGNCFKCCPSFDCDCCCEPCCPCCDVCFDCCCPTSLIPTLCPYMFPENFGTTTVATADWKLRLNLLDGEIGRKFFVSKWVTLRPFFGVRGAWITQCYDVKYQSDINLQMNNVIQDIFMTVESLVGCMTCCTNFESCYEAAGPRIGLNSEWTIAGGFGLYANAAISLVYGEYNFKQRTDACLVADLTGQFAGQQEPIDQAYNDCAVLELRDDFCAGKMITDLALGIQWHSSFAKDRVGVLIQIGYDHHLFLNQNPLIHLLRQDLLDPLVPFVPDAVLNPTTFVPIDNKSLTLSDRRQGDLSLQGLTVSARLDF